MISNKLDNTLNELEIRFIVSISIFKHQKEKKHLVLQEIDA